MSFFTDHVAVIEKEPVTQSISDVPDLDMSTFDISEINLPVLTEKVPQVED